MNGQLSHRHAHKFRLGGSIDMLTGPLLKKILLFGLPLMASSILQLLFNAADVVVLGRYASYASLAAVGSTTAIVNLMINLLIGISIGVNVLVARYLGEGDKQKELSEAVHTAVAVALIGGVILGGIGCATASWILELISTPEDIFDLARIYLNIYFLGTPAIAVYNYGAAILRARGDTQRPLLFLTVSGVTNVALNLLFVISFQMDVAGVALATVISEVLSAVLVLVSLMRSRDELAFSWRKLRIHRRSLSLMSKVGIPAGIQGCLFSLANLAIQGAINAYGSVVVAGSSAAGSIDGFIYVSMNTFHQTVQTFLSQNIGAGKYDRVKDILKKCLLCTVVTGAILCTVACVFSHPLLRIYNQDPAVVAAGTVRLGGCAHRRHTRLRQPGAPGGHQSAVYLRLPSALDLGDKYGYRARHLGLCLLPRLLAGAAYRPDGLLAAPVPQKNPSPSHAGLKTPLPTAQKLCYTVCKSIRRTAPCKSIGSKTRTIWSTSTAPPSWPTWSAPCTSPAWRRPPTPCAATPPLRG